MKPYHQISIQDCGEPLVEIPANLLHLRQPHPYAQLGAPYGERSPYCLRQGVLTALLQSQQILQQTAPTWRLQVFDAYRPIAVQQFMVNHSFAELARQHGWQTATLSETQRQELWQQVYQFWAVPSMDRATPPPHSTGAAIDLTLIHLDKSSVEVLDLGGEIDEISPRSWPDYYRDRHDPQSQIYHDRRQVLKKAMVAAGFRQHPNEWWHFCLGDQMWSWLVAEQRLDRATPARYGRVD